MGFNYPVIILEQGPAGGFVAIFPDVPEVCAHGENEGEVLLAAEGALDDALAGRLRGYQSLPVIGRTAPAQHAVQPSALKRAKLSIYAAMMAQGISKSELARRLGWHRMQIERLFDLRNATRMNHIEAAAHALGLSVKIDIG